MTRNLGIAQKSAWFLDHRSAVHTNGVESFWSLLKRTLKGTYISAEPCHLGRCLDEQSFRFNERSDDDAGQFRSALSSVFGKKLTYRELTGNDQIAAAS